MALTLPTMPLGTSTELKYRSSSVDHKPMLGGPTQRLSRLGDRYSIKVECRVMYAKQAAPIVAILNQALSDKLLVTVPQPGTDTSVWTNGTVSGSVSGGKVIAHAGGGATKIVGQYISIIIGGVRYLHQITAVSGANLTINPALKRPLTGGEIIEFGSPKLEGFVAGNEQTWMLGGIGQLTLSFEVEEAQ